MRRAFAVAALAAVLLTGCRAATSGDAAPNPAAPTAPATQPPATVAPSPAATQPAVAPAQVDSDLSTVEGLLGDLDDDTSKADQAPPDGD